VGGDFLDLKTQFGKDLQITPYQPTLEQLVVAQFEPSKKQEVTLPEASLRGTQQAIEYLQKYRGYEEGQARKLAELYGLYQGFGAWNHYIIIPVRDMEGQPIGYTSRNVTSVGPKTKHAAGMDKSEWLLGADVCLQEHGPREVILTEGPFDVFRLHSYGYPAVATLGPPVKAQLLLLKSVFRKVYTAFDGDLAGRKYQKKVAEVIPVQHFQLPYGKDPDDLSEQQARFVFREKRERSLVELMQPLLESL
jgi:DNA primase